MSLGEFSFAPGQLVLCNEERWIIREHVDFSHVLAERVGDKHMAVLEISGLALLIDPAKTYPRKLRSLAHVELLPKKQADKVPQAIKRFDSLVAVEPQSRSDRALLTKMYAYANKCSRATAYRHYEGAIVTGQTASLVRAVRSDKGQGRLPPQTEAIIQQHLEDHCLVETPRTIPYVTDMINAALADAGLKGVHKLTVYRRLRDITHKDQLKARGLGKQARDLYSAKAGHLPDNDYPLGIVEIDHTRLPVCLVDRDRKPIGTPWLSLVLDCYSRMVLGFYLGLEQPGTQITGMALAHAMLPKEQYLAAIGVNGQWPCWGRPDVVLVDNATELSGTMMTAASRRYRFNLRLRPVGGPNFGGHIESLFKTLMFEIKALPGSRGHWIMETDFSPEKRAVVSLKALEKYLVEFFVNDHHLKKHSGEGMRGRTPLQRWHDGVFVGDVFPPTGLPATLMDPDALRISLLPMEFRTLERGTVRIKNQKYHSGQLYAIAQRHNATADRAKRSVEVRYDKRNVGCIWVYDNVQELYIRVPNTDPKMEGISEWEIAAVKKAERDRPDEHMATRVDSRHRRQKIVQNESTQTKKGRREAETRRSYAQEALLQPPPPRPAPRAVAPVEVELDEAELAELRASVRTSAEGASK